MVKCKEKGGENMGKRDVLLKEIENHLRLTARQLLKFDTEEEVLQYLADSFQSRLNCYFVGVIVQEKKYIHPKAWSGGHSSLKKALPLEVEKCSQKLLTQSITYEADLSGEQCAFIQLLRNSNVKTWFTVPIYDEKHSYGFITIGYEKYITLLELEQTFDEFGKDVALAISLTKRNKQEQKRRLGIEFISENLSLNESIENLVGKIVGQARKGTNSSFVGLYLYDDEQNYFKLQPPSYGKLMKPEKILVRQNYVLKEYFPYLETTYGPELTVPLTIDLKTFGVLHVEKENRDYFTDEDLEMLTIMAEHVSSLLSNAYLFKKEKEQMKRLQTLLDYQQVLIKKTIKEEDFKGITSVVSTMFNRDTVLFDRFLRPITYEKKPSQININMELEDLNSLTEQQTIELVVNGVQKEYSLWPVNGGRDILGFLALEKKDDEFDPFDRLGIDVIRNIYSVQFIKQKLVMDTKNQVTDSFIEKLLTSPIEDQETIIQYANLFQWNVFQPHRVAVLSVEFDKKETGDILERQAKKTAIFDQLKNKISMFDSDILFAKKSDVYIIFVPTDKELPNESAYWSHFSSQITRWLKASSIQCKGKVGIGGKSIHMEDYHKCYKQALQTLNVVMQQDIGQDYAFFEDLGSYTLLHLIKDTSEAKYFMQSYLEKLISYSSDNNMNLFKTLRVYIEQNGSIKNTAEKLFIHRSTLLYRLEKIKEILDLDIDESENRFNIMMTYKLYDLLH